MSKKFEKQTIKSRACVPLRVDLGNPGSTYFAVLSGARKSRKNVIV
jgi:hypothetical protein